MVVLPELVEVDEVVVELLDVELLEEEEVVVELDVVDVTDPVL